MEFKQLEMFVALADERHVARAAERVFRTQPAVSMAIAKLEEEVDAKLFVRSENFRLTRFGEILYVYAEQLLRLRDEATAALCRGPRRSC
jgi:DNA-binding transcriptional LysR family regulator